ncbi:hypothetical protein AC578_7520 [Pseudocercospora eumusae]|uniref:DUF6590 domain-containing protein n=1 Tax=Pseudocercospora eumusae TaxID=321146 RepID=A0A139GWL2_9PEZI|nr:hypothetical protein AC578_7520 [Pseudocercospora eumusae]
MASSRSQYEYDSQQQAPFVTNPDGSRTYFDERSGDTFKIIQGARLYHEKATNRFYYLDSTWRKIYYDAASQSSQQATSQGTIRTAVGYDERTGVQTIFSTGAAKDITEPAAFRLGVSSSKLILGTDTGDEEKADPSYARKQSSYFIVGRVIELLWVEPRGETAPPSMITRASNLEDIGHIKKRRFVLLITGHKHSTALGIFTYNGQGVGKPGVRKSDHCIIYDGRLRNTAPGPMPTELPQREESPMRPTKIRVDLNNNVSWHPTSRINLAKAYTIEHNVKVKDIGMIHPHSIDNLMAMYWQVQIENTSQADERYLTIYQRAIDAMRRPRADSRADTS